MESGTLTKVLHDFMTTVEEELSLFKDDYFLIHNVIDKHWCYGQSHNRTGKFPLNYLHKVHIPQIQDDEALFVSIAAFSGEQAGDLSFGKGELIVGIHEVETDWYLGYILDSRKGIFPISHVWRLDTTFIKKAACGKTVRKKARVKAKLKAQLDKELDLTEGEIVTVLEVLDDGWCRGVTEDGREGTFPEGFVTYIEDNTNIDQIDRSSAMENDPSPSSAIGSEKIYKEHDSRFTEPFEEEPAPNYYDLFPEYAQSSNKESQVVLCDTNLNPLGVKPYAITLYPFNAQFPNELSFAAGEVVHLIKHVDSEWAEGSIDNVKGIFPISYVNIIVDCLDVKENQTSSDQNQSETDRKEWDVLVPGSSVRVEYTFDAQMDGDLSIAEGDIVTVVEMANDDWVNVKNKYGEVGLCPKGYLNSDFEPSVESNESQLEDFVVIRNVKEDSTEVEEQRTKRLSEPHRPAPPAPAPGRIPLQRQSSSDKTILSTEVVEQDEATNGVIAVAKQKKADQRQNVISELVLTEKEYVRDLKITYEIFNLHNPSLLESRGIDVTMLFGNILEVIQVAEDLLDMMLRSMKGCDEELQTIGPCFLKMAGKLQTVYVKYCGNHEAALILLKKYEENKEIMAIFEKGIETLRHQIACFDMSSILIKPVQRILKYPLMLYELIKSTEDGHPDKAEIEKAWKTMTDVASYINEYKRRKDIVSKYLDGENTLMRKMAKLNMHSVAKMSTRLSAKLSASLGLTNLSVDPEFEELERHFKSLEKCTWQLAKDAEQCIIHLGDEAICGELLANLLNEYYQGTPNNEVRKLRETRSIIWSQFIQELKFCIDRRVTAPTTSLMTLLEGPVVLITKRHDKLLDYDAAISKSEKNRDSKTVQDELSSAKSNYEALNQQLLEELPLLIDATTKILVNCIGAFANARKLFNGKITKRYLALSESITQVTPQDILESFLINHNLLWNQITRFGLTGINPRIDEGSTDWCVQSEKQKIALRNKYSNDRLYVVIDNVASASSLDMGAGKGTLVAIIKKQDPMGDTTRWFVDNGVIQGFLPRQSLKPMLQYRHSIETNDSPIEKSSNTADLICMNSPKKEVSSERASCYLNINMEAEENHLSASDKREMQHYINLNSEYYYALYNFEGQLPGTLTIFRGQALRLVQPHDEKGNNAWWLVQDRHGKSGYVPQNYLGSTLSS